MNYNERYCSNGSICIVAVADVVGFAFHWLGRIGGRAQNEALKYKLKLSGTKKQKRIFTKYLNKPFQLANLDTKII